MEVVVHHFNRRTMNEGFDKNYYHSSTRYSRFVDKQLKIEKKKFLHTSCFLLVLYFINN